MITWLFISAIVIGIYYKIYTREGIPHAQDIKTKWLLPSFIISSLLGAWGGTNHWAGATDKLPFMFIGLILPLFSIIQGIRVRKPLACAIIGGSFGFLFVAISYLFYQDRDIITFIFILTGEGLLLGGLSSAIAKSALRKKEIE